MTKIINRIFQVSLACGLVVALGAAGCGQTKTEQLLLNSQEIKDPATDEELPPAVKWILASPDRFEFMTIGSYWDRSLGMPRVEEYPILGTTLLTQAAQQRLVDSLYDAVRHNDHAETACFDPGYAITAVRGASQVTILICFRCKHIEIHQNRHCTVLVISDSPQELFVHLALSMKPPVQQPI